MNVMNAITMDASLLRDAHHLRIAPPAATRIQPRSDRDVRESYNTAVSQAYQAFAKEAEVFHRNQECFGDDLARKAFDTRDAIKKAHQAQTSWLGQVGIWIRNLLTYGGGNASYEGLSKKKNPEEIAYSAFKTNGADLGLNGNGFGDILDTWNAIKADSDLYPEDITPAMVAVFKAQPADQVDPAAILAARTADMPHPAKAGAALHAQSSDDADSVAAARPALVSQADLLAVAASHTPRRARAAYI